MAVIVKFQSLSVEKKIQPKGYAHSITVGIKAYTGKQAKKIQKESRNLSTDIESEVKAAELAKFVNDPNVDKTDRAFYIQREAMQAELENLQEVKDTKIIDFCKSQILYILNASITIDGVDITIPDTRKAEKFESPVGVVQWEGPESCLAVLLDTYFDFPAYGDSLTTTILYSLYNMDDSQEAKVKN